MTITQNDLVRLANNPVRGINRVTEEIERNWFDGYVPINSKSHPFVFATDLILGTTHGVLNRVDDSISKLFPVHAKNLSHLSRHMGEDEKVGLFANPSSGTLQLIIEEVTFLAISKPTTETIGRISFSYNKLLIPKDTEITISGYTYQIENGIEIRYNERTHYQVVYDETTNSFFNPIQENILDRETLKLGNRNYLSITVPVRQLKTKPVENITSNKSSGCSGTIEYDDYLYGIKANITNNGVKQEILVSYNQDTFDPSTVTLALDLDTANKTINYEIPDTYINSGTGVGVLDVYVFTTKGELVKDFSDINLDEIKVNYQDYRYGSGKLGEYSSKLRNSGGIAWKPIKSFSGGSNPVSFEKLKSDFIRGRRIRNLPITENNLLGTVENYGYEPIKSIDFTTGRKYNLTRDLPVQTNKGLYSGIGCTVGSILISISDLVATGLVFDHDTRVTIPNNVLFSVKQEESTLVTKNLMDQYLTMTNEEKVELLRTNTLVYSPFHYVMDMSNHQVNLRTFHLDNPSFDYQTFLSENTALGVEVGVGSIEVEHKPDGYLITLVTRSGSTYKDLTHDGVGIQLNIAPPNSNALASIKGTLVGVTPDGERVFEFKLASTFDVDHNNLLVINNLHQYGEYQPVTAIPLTTTIGLIFLMSGDKTETDTESDRKINNILYPNEMLAIIETQYKLTFGKELNNLYSRVRPLTGVAQYQQYATDVYARYTTDVLERDVNGEIVFINGVPIIEHRAGDVKLNPDGLPIILHRAGDRVVENGEFVLAKPRNIEYHWDFIGFDANYMFSKDIYDIDFANETKKYFTEVIDKDLDAFNSRMLDQTDLVFQPRSKIGYAKVLVNSNKESYIKQDLTFTLTYYLTPNGYRNQNLRESLKASAPKIINEELEGATTVGTGILIKALKKDLVEDVIDVKIEAIAGDASIDVISNQNGLTGFGVRKQLRLTGDGLLTIIEDIEVLFQEHGSR